MSRRSFNLFNNDVFTLPFLAGTVDVWLDVNDLESCTPFSSGTFVSRIKNKAGDSAKDFVQAIAGNQGERRENQLNGRAAVVNFLSYNSGTGSSYKYMHDRSTAYGIFDVYAINVQATSESTNSTTTGGSTNGVLIIPGPTRNIRKVIRQSDGVTLVDVVNVVTPAGVYSLNTYFLLSDVYYGYKVTDNDYELSINNNTPVAVQVESNTSAFASANHNYAFRMSGAGGQHSFSEKIIIKWPSQTRAEIQADIAAIKNYIQNKYSLW